MSTLFHTCIVSLSGGIYYIHNVFYTSNISIRKRSENHILEIISLYNDLNIVILSWQFSRWARNSAICLIILIVLSVDSMRKVRQSIMMPHQCCKCPLHGVISEYELSHVVHSIYIDTILKQVHSEICSLT